jgi:hypothetical protein
MDCSWGKLSFISDFLQGIAGLMELAVGQVRQREQRDKRGHDAGAKPSFVDQ